MGELIVSLAGTPAGEALALALVLLSALAHAIFGVINKGGMDPFLNRGAINICYSAMTAPLVFFVFPWPHGELWVAIFVSYVAHVGYEYLQAWSFAKGDFTVVYPIARGTGPLASLILAALIFGEHYNAMQWLGGIGLSLAIMGLAFVNIRRATEAGKIIANLQAAILIAVATGIALAIYTMIDAYGVRLAENPFTFIAWVFFSGGFGLPLIAAARWRRLETRPAARDLAVRGFCGAVIAIISFSSIMLALRLGHVGEAAALRETSIIIFGTILGVLIFHEKVDRSRLILIICIAAGAVLVKLG